MSEPTLTIARWPRIPKKNRLSEYVPALERARDYTTEKVRVVESIELSGEHWADFTSSLLKDRAWLSGKGGCDSTAVGPWREFPPRTWTPEQMEAFRAGAYRLVIEVIGPGERFVYVDPQGHGYARYVGFPIGSAKPAYVGTLALENRPAAKVEIEAEPLEEGEVEEPEVLTDNDQAITCPHCGRRIPAGTDGQHPRLGGQVRCVFSLSGAPDLQPVAKPAGPIAFDPDNPEHMADDEPEQSALELAPDGPELVRAALRAATDLPGAPPEPVEGELEIVDASESGYVKPIPVTDPDLDAPDGAVVTFDDGIARERVGESWEKAREQPPGAPEKKGVSHLLEMFNEQSTTDDW